MKVEDLILISVDDHIIEPEDMFDHHMPVKYQDRAPRVVKGTNGAHHWLIEDARAPGLGLNAVIGRPKDEYGMEPVAYDQVRKGCYDVHARIEDMNVNGVLASVNFGSFPGFGGARFFKMKDKALALATIRAYNDWHLHDWCNVYPGRFIPNAYLPLWDVGLAVEELERVAKLGFRCIAFPENPKLIDMPSVHDEQWEAIWKVCSDQGIVVNCHIGSAGNAPYASDLTPIEAWITSMPISIATAAADWLFAKFWKKFPDLRMALSEGGIGWIPYLLERADFTSDQHGAWTRGNLRPELPSEVFKRHIMTCFIADRFGIENRHAIGVDMIAWECDYPHSDAVWPRSPEVLWETIQDVPKDEIDKMTHLNVMREYHFDPFAILGRENCTVGALRAKAAHVSTEPLSKPGLKPLGDGVSAVTAADVIKVLSHL
jgi:predicted TIM-barrel fold metal-dependent hydrolase